MTLDYGKVTLEDLEMYHYYEFECDGDSKKVIIRRKRNASNQYPVDFPFFTTNLFSLFSNLGTLQAKAMNKKFKVSDPLYFGAIWDEEFMTDTQLNKPLLKKYKFRRTNKSKKNHRYQCKFWNNRLDLTIDSEGVAFEPYSINEETQQATIDMRCPCVVLTKKEIDYFISTMDNINYAIENKETHIGIDTSFYEFRKQYSNGAFAFYKNIDDTIQKSVVFWYGKSGGQICLLQGNKEDIEDVFKYHLKTNISDGEIYFMKPALHIPLNLLKTIRTEMEMMPY